MNSSHCPICYERLETLDVAPCADCGHLVQEIEHALKGKHTYAEMRIFGDLALVLCDFCQVDFDSYHPEYFGLPPNARIGYKKLAFLREVSEVLIGKDKYCGNCDRRLAFLEFLSKSRELHNSQKTD
jgi:hypothetical protein